MSDIGAVDAVPDALALFGMQKNETTGEITFAKTVPQCHTCTSEFRLVIEQQYIIGQKAKDIIEILEPAPGAGIGASEESINEHFRLQHCTHPAALRLVKKWRSAINRGLDPQDYADTISKSAAIVDIAVDQINEEIKSGKIDMDMKDRIALLKLQWEMEKASKGTDDAQYDSKQMFIAFSIFMSLVQATFARFTPMNQHEAMEYFRRLLDADPILKKIIEDTREAPSTVEDFDEDYDEEEPVDAEIVVVPQILVDSLPETGYTRQAEEPVDPNEEWETYDLS